MSSIIRRAGSKLVRLITRANDPAADDVQIYGKNDGANNELWARTASGIYQLTPPSGGGGGGILEWGARSIGGQDPVFIPPGWLQASAGIVEMQWPIPRDGTLRNFFVRHNVATGSAVVATYTLLRNGIATAITTSRALNMSGQSSDLVNTLAVNQGDRVSLRCSKSGDPGGSNSVYVVASVELA